MTNNLEFSVLTVNFAERVNHEQILCFRQVSVF